jgi:hypothetical protein
MRELCSRLLHKFPGFITVACWIRLKALKNAFGISARTSHTDGAGMSWFTRLREASKRGRDERESSSIPCARAEVRAPAGMDIAETVI